MLDTDFKLLHCMSTLEYLEAALCQGLMFTDHEVNFELSSDPAVILSFLDDLRPMIESKLATLGKPFCSLSDTRKRVLMMGLGSMKGSIPMLSFTEVPTGKLIHAHAFSFGSYGIVMSRSWVERNGGDRVIYIGDNSTVTRHLFTAFAAMKISGLIVASSGEVVFENNTFSPALNLLAHFQKRDHVTEAEWRISGGHGFMGGVRDTGKRLPFYLSDVEYIFVPNKEKTEQVSKLVSDFARSNNSNLIPTVMPFPEQIPQ